VAGDGPQTRGPAGGEGGREVVEHSVHVHHPSLGRHLPDPRPLGVPAVVGIVTVAGLGQAEGVPCAAVQQFEDYRAAVPADRPQRGLVVGAAIDPARPSDVGELLPLDDPPRPAVPFGQHAQVVRTAGIAASQVLTLLLTHRPLTVVGDHQPALSGVTSLAMPAGDGLLEQPGDLQRVHVHLVDRPFHVEEVDLVRRVSEVAATAVIRPTSFCRSTERTLPAASMTYGPMIS